VLCTFLLLVIRIYLGSRWDLHRVSYVTGSAFDHVENFKLVQLVLVRRGREKRREGITVFPASNFPWAATTMSSPYLPAELLDHIVDHLHDTKDALKSCGLVSKSWIPRTRRHLFADAIFGSPNRLQSWKSTFPNPSSSPAGYAKYLFIRLPLAITAADAKEGDWIPAFSNVVHFEVDFNLIGPFGVGPVTGASLLGNHLALFCGFSPVTKTFRMSLSGTPSSQVFDLIRSFPLLEDLSLNDLTRDALIGIDDDFVWQTASAIQPSSPPAFTGSLELSLDTGINATASWLLSLPRGPHCRELCLTWKCKEDVALTTALIERCSSTLESIMVGSGLSTFILHLPLH
jgi:hypothetical protein